MSFRRDWSTSGPVCSVAKKDTNVDIVKNAAVPQLAPKFDAEWCTVLRLQSRKFDLDYY
jgi:hypothetical protein